MVPYQSWGESQIDTFWIFLKIIAGTHSSKLTENGDYQYSFNFNDRGRGPEIEQRFTLNKEGFIDNLEISGVNYLKDTIHETFKFENNKAIWKSSSESGEIESSGNAFFSSINGTLGESEILLQKLLNTPDQKVDLLPSGSVAISDIDHHNIDGNDLRLIETVGFGFDPNYIWVDASDRVFASVSSWLSIIEEEHASMLDQMLEIQTNKKNDYFKKIAENKKFPHSLV